MIIKSAIFSGSSTCTEQKPRMKAHEYAFIGRSNVGKSSLINMLCGRKDLAHTSSTPGKTLLINHFLINGKWFLVDLPGYGFAKASKKTQAELKKMIEDYVSHSEELATLFILIDSRHPLQEIDRNFITAVAGAEIPFAIIMTKCDKLTANALKKSTENLTREIAGIKAGVTLFQSSAEKKRGRDEILAYIEENLNTLIQ